jgi:hypothetical protein
MHAGGKNMAAHHEENDFRIARIAVIGLVARPDDMPGGGAPND